MPEPDGEAAWIAQGALALHGEGVAYRDMAVLYRAHYASRPVEEALLRAEVPHAVYSGVPFFGRHLDQDALSVPAPRRPTRTTSTSRAWRNAPKRNLGARRMAFLREKADELGCSLFEALERFVDDDLFKRTKARQLLQLVDRFRSSYEVTGVEGSAAVLSESGYERALRTEGSQERLDNLAELKQSVYEFETTCGEEVTLEHYLAHTATYPSRTPTRWTTRRTRCGS